MEILQVRVVDEDGQERSTFSVSETLRLFFSIEGAQGIQFEFPFSNESLVENKIEFKRKEV